MIYIKLLLTALFWGGTFIAGRIATAEVSPYFAAFTRFAIASLPLLLIAKATGQLVKIKFSQLVIILLLGFTGVFAYNIFFFKGLKLVNAGRAGVIIGANPILIAILAAVFFKEKLTWLRTGGIIISITGAIIAISQGDLANISNGKVGIGELYILVCAASWVAFSLIGKPLTAKLSSITIITYSVAAGAFFLFIPACFDGFERNLASCSLKSWIAIAYLGVFGTAIAFVWYYQGIKQIGPTKAGIFINFVPISAILLAFLILAEPISPSLAIGAVLVTAGVYLTNKKSSV